MALPDIILQRGELLVTESSGSEIQFENNGGIFGQIEMVSDVSDNYGVGNYIWFNPEGAVLFKFDDISYSLITVDKVLFIENYSAP